MKLLLIVFVFGTSHAYIPSIESSIYPTVENRQKIIHTAAKFANIVKGLIDIGTDINPKNHNGQTPLFLAVLAKSDAVKVFVEHGADVNVHDNWGNTPLGWAVFLDDENMTEVLVRNGADVNAIFNKESTHISPLLLAVMFGQVKIVKILAEHGADLEFQFMGMGALHHAAYRSGDDYVKVLLGNGAKVNAQISGGRTPIHLAALENRSENIKLILEYGADVNAKDSEGNTALHVAAMRGNVDVIKILIDYNADLSIKNENGQTPRDIAVEMAEELNSKGYEYSWIDAILKIAEDKSKLLRNIESSDFNFNR